MPRPSRLTAKKARALYRSLQAAWRFVLNLEPPNWKTVEQIHEELRSLEVKGFDRPLKDEEDQEVE